LGQTAPRGFLAESGPSRLLGLGVGSRRRLGRRPIDTSRRRSRAVVPTRWPGNRREHARTRLPTGNVHVIETLLTGVSRKGNYRVPADRPRGPRAMLSIKLLGVHPGKDHRRSLQVCALRSRPVASGDPRVPGVFEDLQSCHLGRFGHRGHFGSGLISTQANSGNQEKAAGTCCHNLNRSSHRICL